MIRTYLLIIFLLIVGTRLLYWRKKRKFDRLNEHGIERFNSYREKVAVDTFNTVLKWIGYASLIVGFFLIMGL